MTVTIRTLDEIGYIIWSPKGVAGPLVDDAIADAKARGYTEMDVSEWLRVELRRPAPQPPAEPWWWALRGKGPGVTEWDRVKTTRAGAAAYWADGTIFNTYPLGHQFDVWGPPAKERGEICVYIGAGKYSGGLWVRPGDVVRA